jgi:hypothetical protein
MLVSPPLLLRISTAPAANLDASVSTTPTIGSGKISASTLPNTNSIDVDSHQLHHEDNFSSSSLSSSESYSQQSVESR